MTAVQCVMILQCKVKERIASDMDRCFLTSGKRIVRLVFLSYKNRKCLYSLMNLPNDGSRVVRDALYSDIVGFLLPEQRRELFDNLALIAGAVDEVGRRVHRHLELDRWTDRGRLCHFHD